MLLLAAAISAPAADVGTASVRAVTVEVPPNSAPQPFRIGCAPGQQLIGGGFAPTGRDLRVTSSHPAPDGSWVVEVWNPTKLQQLLRIEANCLTAGEGRSTLHSNAGQAPSVQVNCPQGTIVASGGFASSWTPRVGGAVVVGSYPLAGNGWGVQAVNVPVDTGAAPGTPRIDAFVLCLDGPAKIASARTERLNLNAGEPSCLASPITASVCTFPRSAQASVKCVGDEVLSGVGYEVTAGTMPAFSMLTVNSSQFAVATTSRDNAPLAIRYTWICLTWPAAEPEPVSLAWPIGIGAGVLLVLLLALLVTYVVRSRTTPAATAGLDVVVKSQQSTFRLDRIREVP